MDSEQLDKEKRRGEHAARLLNDDLLQEVLDELEKEIVSKWEITPPRDVEAREYLWNFYVISKKFRNTLQSLISTGEMAKVELERSVMEKTVNYFRR